MQLLYRESLTTALETQNKREQSVPFWRTVPTQNSTCLLTMTRQHLIVDTAAFIKLKQLEQYGYETAHVVPGVVAEIRDHTARHNLQFSMVLPKVSVPTEQDIAVVQKFAKASGDIGFLSETDIEVIALTYMLQRLTGDMRFVRKEPKIVKHKAENDTESSHFLWGTPAAACSVSDNPTTHGDGDLPNNDDDEGGWIGEETLQEYSQARGLMATTQKDGGLDESSRLRVACLTTDFSVQNVLLHMGLTVLSIDGMRVREAKTWALLCRGCRTTTRDTTRLFCPSCGNATLRRVPMKVNADGDTIVEITPYTPNLRGKVYSIPKPKGGRQGDLVLCEDQLMIGGRDRLLRQRQKQLLKQKIASDPFNEDNAYEQSGWWSHTARGTAISPLKGPQIGLGKGNPNSNRWQKRHNERHRR